MPVTYDDLIFPHGRMQLSMFPGQDLNDIAKRMIAKAQERMTELAMPALPLDAAVTAWVYWTLFTALADYNALEGSEQRDIDVTTKWSKEDRERFGKEATRWGTVYQDILTVAGITDPLGPQKEVDVLPILQAWQVGG
jgi:hypothetical protein